MHRVTRRGPRILLPLVVRVVVIAALVGGLTGCATAPQRATDPPAIDKLRVRITKTRHAIRETREAIIAAKGSPKAPELYVRLAELLSEEARYHNQVAYEREERKSRLIHAPQVRLLKQQAIDVYRDVLARYPDTPLGARVRFNIGHEQRELGDFPAMVEQLTELVAKHPGSHLADEALLVLGDYHFDKSDLDAAGRFYGQITARPMSRVSALAHYKMGWVHVNKASCAPALTSFEAALDASDAWRAHAAAPHAVVVNGTASIAGSAADDDATNPSSAQSIDVRREALVDLVYCYTQERELDRAATYLRERAANRATYVAALRKMAHRLSLIGRQDAGLPVSRELLRFAPADVDRLDDARVHYTFVKRDLKGATPTPKRRRRTPATAPVAVRFKADDVRLMTNTVLGYAQRPDVAEAEREETLAEFERYARDVLTTAHKRAQELPDEARAAALTEVHRGYVVYLDTFPVSEARVAMLQNLADVLGEVGAHYEAGMRQLEVAELETDADKRQESLFTAVGHLQKALEAGGPRRPVARVVARAALRRAGLTLITMARDGGKIPDQKLRAVKFAVALAYFDEGHHTEAIDRFTALAYEAPGTEESKAAMLLALDSLGARLDFDGMITTGRRFIGAGGPAGPDVKARITPLIAYAEQRKLDELALAAAGTGGTDLGVLERFAERYQGTDLGERALLNAFVAARAVGNSGALQRLGQQIVTAYPKSDEAVGVISTMARNAVASLDYDQAIAAFKRAATTDAGEAMTLLLAAADLSVELGDEPGAFSILKQALAGAKTAAARSQIGGRLAERLERQGASPAEVVAVLGPLASDRDPRVLAALGLAQVALGQVDAGEGTLQGALRGQGERGQEARARAQYGSAEALAQVIKTFEADGTLDALNELTALVDLVEESYMTAARLGDSLVTPAALARLAANARMAAGVLRKAPMPPEMSDADKTAIRGGLESRAKGLEELAAGAIATCASQAWSAKTFSPVVRGCLAGNALKTAMFPHDRIQPRRRTGAAPVSAELRHRLTQNADDAEVLAEVGEALLDGGAPHTARLVLARAVSQGGDAKTQNLLGIAHHEVGAYAAALEWFARAADAGLEAGRQNLAAGLRARSLAAAAEEVFKRWSNEGEAGGRLLQGAGGPR